MKKPVPFTLRLPTANGFATVKVAIGRGPTRLAELVPVALRITDLVVTQAVKAEEKEGRPLACTAGCAACCRQLVPISGPEAFLLADFVAELPPAEQDAVIARFDGAIARAQDAGLYAALEDLRRGVLDAKARAELPSRYFSLQIACPFLSPEGQCGARQVRPVSCRDFNVTTPSAWCSAPLLHPVRKVPMPPTFSEPLARTLATLKARNVELVPLPLALSWVEENAELGFETWPGPELFRTFLAALGVDPGGISAG